MSAYDIEGNILSALYDIEGNPLEYGYDIEGNIIFHNGDILLSYGIYYPEEATDDYSYSSYSTFNLSPDTFLQMYYDPLVSDPPSGVTVTKNIVGRDQTDTYNVYEYDFCPSNPKRTILITSGLHSYEISAQFGLAYFIKGVYDDNQTDEGLNYIRNNVRVKVIPILNPWGASQFPRKYGNVRGVNPNRNWDAFDQWQGYNPASDEWNKKGSAPFSEQETVNIANWLMANYGADFYIDCHTGEGYNQYGLWVNYGDDCKYTINGAIPSALNAQKAWFKTKFGSNPVVNDALYHHDSSYDSRASWMTYFAGIPNFTIEFAPQNTVFGTSLSNEAADIKMYCANISGYVQELLLYKYEEQKTEVPLTAISSENATIASGKVSLDASVTMTPSNSTQNNFLWVSSDTSVVDVYGSVENGELIKRGTGTATITVTSKVDPTITTSFTVTVEA